MGKVHAIKLDIEARIAAAWHHAHEWTSVAFAELLQRRHAIKEFASTGSIPFLPFPPFLPLILIGLMGTLFLRVHLLPAARSCRAEAAETPPRVPIHLGPRLT